MKRIKFILPLALLSVLTLIAYPLYAHCGKCAADGKKIAAQLDQNKTTLAKAVTAAEEHSKGRAISVMSALNDKGQATVHIFCIAGDPSKIMKCAFDLSTGKVTGMKEVTEFPVSVADHAVLPAGGSVMMINNQETEAGCGMCIYKMSGVNSCLLAVVVEGKPYLVKGATWPNHDYCERKCQAIVTGKLEGNTFIATSVTEKK